MRKVFKLIYRLDYQISYDLIDRPGFILKMINTAVPEGYWTDFREAAASHSIKALRQTPSEFVDFTVEPNVITGTFENADGIDLMRVADSPTFNYLNTITEQLCNEFSINNLDRFGLRVFCFEKYDIELGSSLDKFKELLSTQFLTSFSEKIGGTEDIGVTIDGETEDGSKFHINFGPYGQFDTSRFLNKVSAALPEDFSPHITADIDVYDNSFSSQGLSVKRWAREKWRVSDRLLDILKRHMTGAVNGG